MSTQVIGELSVPSGRIVVGDPGTTDFAHPPPPLARSAPTGVFPVEVALAESHGHDTRVACARVRFAARPAVRWEPALFVGQTADSGDGSTYGVDTGMGCFFDQAACAKVDESTMQAWGEALDRRRVDTWTWHVDEVGPANVVMFSSGWGDGLYTSYWGLDAHDEVVELVTDFDVLCEPVWERLEVSLPLPCDVLVHPWLAARGITVRGPRPEQSAAVVRGPPGTSVGLSERMVLREYWTGDTCLYKWKHNTPGLRLVVTVFSGTRPLVPL